MTTAQKQIEQELDEDIREEELSDEYEVEVVDDVPEHERPRVKDHVVSEIPDDDEIESYSERVQKRLKKLSFDVKESERHRAQAAREREEAVRWAHSIQAENERLRKNLEQNQGTMVAQAKARIESELNQAKSSYKEAYELGDTDKMLEAQDRLTTLNNDLYRVNGYRPPQQQKVVAPQAQQAQVPQLNAQQRAWLDKNDWYGRDEQMTTFALLVHKELVHKGVDPNSEEYYNEIDSEMRKRFADKLTTEEDDDDVIEVAPRKRANVVAPATRSSKNPRKVKMTQTQMAIAKRLGVPLEKYAAQLLKDQKNG
jgi:hypothetical protein